ncbi:MAG: hypothetical protein DMG81_10155 [Acidobacteria bacterium]|nr:MAG: hypothetical protein DMG81_10155 [Acidobacteriota bacterium]
MFHVEHPVPILEGAKHHSWNEPPTEAECSTWNMQAHGKRIHLMVAAIPKIMPPGSITASGSLIPAPRSTGNISQKRQDLECFLLKCHWKSRPIIWE